MTVPQRWVAGRWVGLILIAIVLLWDGQVPWAWTLILCGLGIGVAGAEYWTLAHERRKRDEPQRRGV